MTAVTVPTQVPSIKPRYIDNAALYQAIVDYHLQVKALCSENELLGIETIRPRVPNFIGECFMKIATRFSYTNNGRMSFINYTYRDEMVSDAIESCVRALHSFDPEKGTNPFAYFTQVCYFAFLQRIAREKRQARVKQALIAKLPFDLIDLQEHDDPEIVEPLIRYIQTFYASVNSDPVEPKKPIAHKQYTSPLDEFLS